MLAKIKPEYLKLTATHIIEGEFVAETDCHDYDEFRSLPAVIEVEGKLLGKTGWSSDRNYACYKQGVTLGRMVDIKA